MIPSFSLSFTPYALSGFFFFHHFALPSGIPGVFTTQHTTVVDGNLILAQKSSVPHLKEPRWDRTFLGDYTAIEMAAPAPLFVYGSERNATPNVPNPYLAFLPDDVVPNFALWDARLQVRARQRIAQLAETQPDALVAGADFTEQEPNNTRATGNTIASFGTGAEKQSAVDILGELPPNDTVDFFRIELTAGDIVGANLTGGARQLALYDAAESLLIRSTKDATGVLPMASPLPGGGRAALYYVINQTGPYVLGVALPGNGNYRVQLRVFRPVLEQAAVHSRQILFIDFDGATINTSIVWGPDRVSTLAPLADFLAGWGLAADTENAVIDAILATIVENIAADIGGTTGRGANGDFFITGTPGEFAIQLLNSRDHADPFGQPSVSRIIIGGTREQLGLPVIGIAQSVDIGNFVTAETAVLLLDLLSAPASNKSSLNRYHLSAATTKIDLVGVGVGNIASHEIGPTSLATSTPKTPNRPPILWIRGAMCLISLALAQTMFLVTPMI